MLNLVFYMILILAHYIMATLDATYEWKILRKYFFKRTILVVK